MKKITLTSTLILGIIFFTGAVNYSRGNHDIKAELEKYIDARVGDGFCGSVLVAEKGKIILSKGWGYANREHNVPNKPQTKFRIGSITKTFTSMAILQLKAKGLLGLNDSLKKYIPDYPGGEKITVRHLLTHTSGIPDFEFFEEYVSMKTIPGPILRTIGWFKDRPLEFEPGERYKYSSSGYLLLGYIIEKVSDKPFAEYLEENILGPLHMTGTGCDSNTEILVDRAAGYTEKDGKIINADYVDMFIPHAAGAMYSTVEDMYLWHRALYTDRLLSKTLLEEIFTPLKGNYGYGWFIEEKFNRKRISHTGGIDGFTAIFDRYVGDDICIVILSNLRLRPSPLIKMREEIAAMLIGGE